MVYLPTNVLNNILGFYIGLHRTKAEVIARNWLVHYRRHIGRAGRPKLFESSFGWARNGFSNRAHDAYQKAYNHRCQKAGQTVRVVRGTHGGRTGTIARTTLTMLVLEDALGSRFRVSRSSVDGAMYWGVRNKRNLRDDSVPDWWGRWLFTGIRV